MTIAEYPTLLPDNTSSSDARVSLRRVQALYRIGERLAQAQHEAQVFQIAAEELVAGAGYGTSWLITIDYAASTVVGRAGAGPHVTDAIVNAVLPLTDFPVVMDIIADGQPSITLDGLAQAELEGWGDLARSIGLKSLVRMPFGSGPEVLGVIMVSILGNMQVDEEVVLLQLFASQLTTALMKIMYDRERSQQITALQTATVAQQRLLETVRELSTPVIPIYDGILVLPLVGNIDSGRAGQVMEAVLEGIAQNHASVMILDVTGVPVIDTGVANHLVQVTQAAQLLGARCLLVGIKPEVAQTLVQLGVDLRSIVTRSDLQAGVAYALMQRGLKIVSSRN